MYKFSVNVIKKIFFFIFILCITIPAAAKTKAEKYETLIKEGSKAEIKSAFYKDYHMNRTRIGKTKDNLIMTALKYDRDKSIITILIHADINIKECNNLKQNALMYACRYSTDSETISFVLRKFGTGEKLKKQLLKKDKDGYTAYDYARENEDTTAYNLIKGYFDEEQPPAIEISEESPESSTQPEPAPEPEQKQILSEPEEPEPEPTVEAVVATPVEIEQKPEPEPTVEVVVATPVEIEQKPEPKVEPEPKLHVDPTPTVNSYKKTYLYDYAPIEKDEEPSDVEEQEFVIFDNPNKTDASSRTLLMNAVKNGNEWEVRSLIKSKANVNLKDNDGWTALMYASRYQNDADIIQLLIDNGARINDKNNFGSNSLQLAACYSNNPDILAKLLENQKTSANDLLKAFIMAITSQSNTTESQIAKIKLFIEKGISINRFYEGKTPLMYAAEFSKSTEIIKLLIENGASVSIRNQKGMKAFDYASKNVHLPHDDTYWQLNSR